MTNILADTIQATMGLEGMFDAFEFSRGFLQVYLESKEYPRIWFYNRPKYTGIPIVLEHLSDQVIEYLEAGHQPSSWYLVVRHPLVNNRRKRVNVNIKPMMLAFQHKYHRCWHCKSLARMNHADMYDFSGNQPAAYREYRTKCSDNNCMVSAGDNGTFSVAQKVPDDFKDNKVYDFMVRAGAVLSGLKCKVLPLDNDELRLVPTFTWFVNVLETSEHPRIAGLARSDQFLDRVRNTPLEDGALEQLLFYIQRYTQL